MKPYLWDPWATARTHPDRVAVIADGEQSTYGDLTGRADALARGLRAHGIPDGAVVSTDIPTGPAFFALALAALRHGFGLFPIDRELLGIPMGPSLLASVSTAAHISAQPWADGPALPCPVVTGTQLTARADGPGTPATPPAAGRLVFATSGTTGLPQAVARTRPRRPYRGVAVVERYGAGAGRGPHLMANPTYHLGTLGPALYALQAGSTVVVQRTWSCDAFTELADRHRADSVMLSPDRLTDLVEAGAAPRHPFQVVFHGGAACPPGVKRAAIDLFGPVLHEYYGTSHGVITEITTAEWLARPGSVGRPLPGIRVEISREGRPVPAGETGDIDILPRAADRAPSDTGVLKTGDVGHLDDEGYLFVLGRAETPREIRMARLEHDIRLLPGVTDAAALDGAGDVPVCFVEHGHGADFQDPVPAIEATAEQLDLPSPRVVLAVSGSLPRTPSGKLRRADLGVLARSAPHGSR
ncbi:class I adenylate-forming enzyme family protein [Streptomyces sp. NBC_00091]|uniref:class I adenylate-forming enzyme family protein n=1 Tax=Streptomyces sp. NBC_00091 TaxID=2975648 RepID=UPI0022502FAD|nr:AMP-binding protein [Streptomyces sp. NBC_00091]MCX5380164.1 AMP-binding protein [Streptomyces sp. NBC_00091]